jgi:RNA polymerase sigma factor (sigma-70 family)
MMTEMEVKRRQEPGELAFDAFFTSVYPRARATANRIVGPSLAEDVAVEGMARAYARWRAVGRMEYPEAWVMRVVTNVALDEVRRKKARPAEMVVRDSSVDFVVHDTVVEALRTLTRRQQEVVVLRYIVDLPEEEVARILGMSAGTVKTHLHRAIPRLREHLSMEEDAS